MPSIAPSSIAPSSIASSIVDQMTKLFVFIDDYLKTHPRQAAWRRSPNATPAFTDAEVVTIALLQGAFGCATLKRTYQLVAANWRDAFPRLPSYGQWLARLHRLAALVGALMHTSLGIRGLGERVYLLDALPIRVCKAIRHGRVRLLHEDGAYFGKSTTGWFFGFKLHTLVHHSGMIVSAVLTPANFDEREAALALALSAALALALSVEGGVAVADLGYRGRDNWLFAQLAEDADLVLLHPADAGRKGTSSRALVSSVRERIETTFSGLWNRFVDRVLSRSWQGLWSSLKLKMLHYNLCRAGMLPA